ncbi:unnamed protein product [Closterium sp. Yama58-4]|nr:unnamed protein product [Closterium sp. Yama58-4]
MINGTLRRRLRHNFLTEGPVGILWQLAVLRDVVALVDPELDVTPSPASPNPTPFCLPPTTASQLPNRRPGGHSSAASPAEGRGAPSPAPCRLPSQAGLPPGGASCSPAPAPPTFPPLLVPLQQRHKFLTEGPVGILRQLAVLRDVVALMDPELAGHLEELGADNFMFAFRMLLVLFRRELPLLDVIVMWELPHLEELGADNFMFAFRKLLVLFRRELPLLDVIVMWEVRWRGGDGLDSIDHGLRGRWVDPELAGHLEELGADNFMFAFRMLLVLFRRE